MSAQPHHRPTGSRFGEYRIEGLLGVGGMGEVYRARTDDGTLVALKLVKEDFAQIETFRHRFIREARIAQTVKHPNVVAVLASGEIDGLLFMAQQLIDGESLERRLKRERMLDIPAAIGICTNVAAGLEALWAAGTVHRDIKPANILLDAQGRAYITDFGLAKEAQGTLLTLPGQALGSLDYMSTEQIHGEEVTAASDIYALGCVMYECLCGRPPFAHVSPTRVMWAHIQDDPPDPTTLRADVSPALAAALLTALAKEPGDRPESAGEYARLLTDAVPPVASTRERPVRGTPAGGLRRPGP